MRSNVIALTVELGRVVNGEEDYFVNLRAHCLLTEQRLVRETQEQPVKAPKVVSPSLERRLATN